MTSNNGRQQDSPRSFWYDLGMHAARRGLHTKRSWYQKAEEIATAAGKDKLRPEKTFYYWVDNRERMTDWEWEDSVSIFVQAAVGQNECDWQPWRNRWHKLKNQEVCQSVGEAVDGEPEPRHLAVEVSGTIRAEVIQVGERSDPSRHQGSKWRYAVVGVAVVLATYPMSASAYSETSTAEALRVKREEVYSQYLMAADALAEATDVYVFLCPNAEISALEAFECQGFHNFGPVYSGYVKAEKAMRMYWSSAVKEATMATARELPTDNGHFEDFKLRNIDKRRFGDAVERLRESMCVDIRIDSTQACSR